MISISTVIAVLVSLKNTVYVQIPALSNSSISLKVLGLADDENVKINAISDASKNVIVFMIEISLEFEISAMLNRNRHNTSDTSDNMSI
jgi:hypothetical protein